MLVTKINVPLIESSDSNLPLNINVPNSRQQVPSGNSTSPEKLTRLFVNSVHPAGTGSGTGLLSGPVSSNENDPAPFAFGSNIKLFFSSPLRAKLTCHRPVNFPLAGGAACC